MKRLLRNSSSYVPAENLALVENELIRMQKIYRDFPQVEDLKVYVTDTHPDAHGVYRGGKHEISLCVDSLNSRSSASILETIRHEYAHHVIHCLTREDEIHGDDWCQVATFLGCIETDYHKGR